MNKKPQRTLPTLRQWEGIRPTLSMRKVLERLDRPHLLKGVRTILSMRLTAQEVAELVAANRTGRPLGTWAREILLAAVREKTAPHP